MFRFEQLCIGDMFKTIIARWVKTSDSDAICVFSCVAVVGEKINFNPKREVVLLWSSNADLEDLQ